MSEISITDASIKPDTTVAMTCAELADLWPRLEKLPPDEANAFADDLEKARSSLPSLKSARD